MINKGKKQLTSVFINHFLVVLRGPIDLYQIHFPGAWSNEEYWDGIADAHDQGLIKAVGEFLLIAYSL